jgi:shikimate dehydrogenase
MTIDIRGTTRLAGVMGWPVAHSRSPRLHNYWLAKHGIDGAYVPLPVKPENIEAALRALPALGFAGANLTVPHKEAALTIVDTIDPLARRVGAANVVVVGSNGVLEARNTDVYGFVENLRLAAPGWRKQEPAVVLGAGGAARSVIVGLIDAGVPEIRVANRTRSRADVLQALGPQVKVGDWSGRAGMLDGAGLLVNTTLLGMTGQAPLGLDLARLPKAAVVTDVVYVPLETELLAAARRRGHAVVDGLGMLLHQARPAFRAFFGLDPEVTAELRAHVLADR